MKHVYAVVSKTLLIASMVLLFNQARSQNSSTTAPGNCGPVVADFNLTSENHASASIYGGMFDSAFYYNRIRGYWTDLDHDRMTPPLSPRVMSIISQPYQNPSPQGQFNVGFYYIVPNAALDFFQVRIVSVSSGPGGETVTDLVASSGVQRFSAWSSPAPYVDQGVSNAFGTSPANPFLIGDSGHVCIGINDADITNAPGTFYRVEIAYVLNTPGVDNFFAVYDNLRIGGTISRGALPVNFMGIVANRVDNGVQVRWDIADEHDVQEYQLEKSTNGASFSTVGTIPAKNKMAYTLTDPNGKSAVLYYRVKSVDIDGRTKYTGIVKITNSNSYSNTLKVYPTPAQNQLTVQHAQLGASARVQISTMDGRVIRTIKPSTGASNTMVDLTGLSAGMYVLRLDNGTGKTESVTFIKQ
jgi:hypothetical protein